MGALTSLIPWPWRFLAFAALIAAAMGFGYVKGVEHGDAKLEAYKVAQQKAIDAQVAKAAQTTADLKSDALILEGVKNDEIKAIQSRLAAALADSLRERTARRPDLPTVAASCAGVSGAQLAGGDADFLSRYAADAATIQAALDQCRGQYERARQALANP
jgi:hypothetical protein